MEEGVLMSTKEAHRYALLRGVLNKKLTQAQAAGQLGLSLRQVKRLCKALAKEGAAGLVSKKRGRASNRQIAATDRDRWLEHVRTQYADFGPTLAREYLRQDGFAHSAETLRSWMISAGLWQPKRKRKARSHSPRPRRPRRGELIQIDGSPHDWFEGRAPKCCLIAFIDDATSAVLAARFVPAESTQAYMQVLQRYVQTHGAPLAVYSDRHGIFTKHDEHDSTPTQFERALLQLQIESILALSPQAKGRVERLFQTLQDRLVKAMRLKAINDIEQANTYLESYWIEHNARFAVGALEGVDAHRPFTGSSAELARICALHHQRSLSKALSLQFENKLLVVEPASLPTKRPGKLNIAQYRDGRLELLHGKQSIAFKCYDWLDSYRGKGADAKDVNNVVDELAQRAQRKETNRLARLSNELSHQDHLRASRANMQGQTPLMPDLRYGLRPTRRSGISNCSINSNSPSA